jgi:hypothetical protein
MPTWDEDDNMVVVAAAIPPVAGSATGTYTATEQGIINATSAAVNAIIVALRAANIIAED